jgi:5,6-dimethylbenzimidazole synthase
MEFQEVIRARRSCRSFDPSAVAQEQLSAILDAGQWAPSPLNLQPWEFIVITDPEKKMRIREAGEVARQRVVDSGGPGWVKKYSMGFVEEAPVMIAVVFDPTKGGLGEYFQQPYGALQAASACVQNMMLAAAEFGLGTLWFTFFNPDKVRAILNIPQDREIAAIILIGKPKQTLDAPPRKAPKIHPEQYQAMD